MNKDLQTLTHTQTHTQGGHILRSGWDTDAWAIIIRVWRDINHVAHPSFPLAVQLQAPQQIPHQCFCVFQKKCDIRQTEHLLESLALHTIIPCCIIHIV